MFATFIWAGTRELLRARCGAGTLMRPGMRETPLPAPGRTQQFNTSAVQRADHHSPFTIIQKRRGLEAGKDPHRKGKTPQCFLRLLQRLRWVEKRSVRFRWSGARA